MKKFIELTNDRGGKVYINVDSIGHLYQYTKKAYLNHEVDKVLTTVGTLCHNNGGFDVIESVDEILKLINAN